MRAAILPPCRSKDEIAFTMRSVRAKTILAMAGAVGSHHFVFLAEPSEAGRSDAVKTVEG
jgi:hypothetical protein